MKNYKYRYNIVRSIIKLTLLVLRLVLLALKIIKEFDDLIK